jgi:hypothetical protein
VDDRVNLGVLVKDIIKGLLVCNIHLIETWSLASDELDAVDNFLVSIVEVVDNDNIVVGLEEGDDGERTNVAAATIERC